MSFYGKNSTTEKYNIRTFQNRAECPHTTSGYFSQYRGKCTKQHEFLFFFGVTRKYRYRGDTQDVV